MYTTTAKLNKWAFRIFISCFCSSQGEIKNVLVLHNISESNVWPGVVSCYKAYWCFSFNKPSVSPSITFPSLKCYFYFFLVFYKTCWITLKGLWQLTLLLILCRMTQQKQEEYMNKVIPHCIQCEDHNVWMVDVYSVFSSKLYNLFVKQN